MKRPPVPGTVVLQWVESHEWKVPVEDVNDPNATARAARMAIEGAGIFQRYGVMLESIALGAVPDVRNGDTPTYP